LVGQEVDRARSDGSEELVAGEDLAGRVDQLEVTRQQDGTSLARNADSRRQESSSSASLRRTDVASAHPHG
jgi:hypothetical protein